MVNEKSIDTVMLYNIEKKTVEAEAARQEVLTQMALLNQKYDSDKQLRELSDKNINRRLNEQEEFKKYATRGLITILIGIIISISTSIAGMVIANSENQNESHLTNLLIDEIKGLRQSISSESRKDTP